jgi:entericidin B
MLSKFKLLPVFVVALFSLSALSACNTVEGAGEDIEAAGDKIEDSASENKNY